jgi:hypothetical protein
VFLGKTTIPSGQIIRILLKRIRQLGAGQLLNIEISIGICVRLEFDLSNGLSRNDNSRATENEFLYDHWLFSLTNSGASNLSCSPTN